MAEAVAKAPLQRAYGLQRGPARRRANPATTHHRPAEQVRCAAASGDLGSVAGSDTGFDPLVDFILDPSDSPFAERHRFRNVPLSMSS